MYKVRQLVSIVLCTYSVLTKVEGVHVIRGCNMTMWQSIDAAWPVSNVQERQGPTTVKHGREMGVQNSCRARPDVGGSEMSGPVVEARRFEGAAEEWARAGCRSDDM